MNDSALKLRLATLALLAAVVIVVFMNTCALDRIERQVLKNTKAVETLVASGGLGSRGGTVSARPQHAGTARPGTGTGVEALGWNGRRAELLHVEGAAPGAPLLIADKPRPQNDTYVNRRTRPPSTLNYYATNEGDASTVTRYTYGRLMMVNVDAPPEVLPELATSWEVSEDGREYTYHLRRGVQFADGRSFSSADVAFSFQVVRDAEVKADHLRSEFDDVESLETPDPHTVVVRYRKKFWKGIYSIGYTLRILNKGWYEEQIPVWAAKLGIDSFSTEPGQPGFAEVFNKISIPPPGAGPYYYPADDYDPTRPIVLVQNPFHFGIQVHPEWWNLRKLRWIFISDSVAAFEEFRKKKFDITVVDFQPWDDEYSKDETITSISNYYEYDHIGLGYSFITWNNRKAPFDDPRVRRAMTHLTNRQWILDEIERGRGSVATCASKRMYPDYASELEPLAFDLEAARRLLAEAGWADSDGDGVLDRNGERFEFELKVGSSRRFYIQVGAVLEDACKKVGIRMQLRTLEWATFIQDYYERRFDAVCLYNSFADPWVDNYETFHSSQDVPQGGNGSGFRNAEADRLLEAIRAEFDPAQRNRMSHELYALIQQEQPMTLLVHGVVGVLMSNRYENVKVRPTGMQFLDFWIEDENVLHP